jgi:hypothetical protein
MKWKNYINVTTWVNHHGKLIKSNYLYFIRSFENSYYPSNVSQHYWIQNNFCFAILALTLKIVLYDTNVRICYSPLSFMMTSKDWNLPFVRTWNFKKMPFTWKLYIWTYFIHSWIEQTMICKRILQKLNSNMISTKACHGIKLQQTNPNLLQTSQDPSSSCSSYVNTSSWEK